MNIDRIFLFLLRKLSIICISISTFLLFFGCNPPPLPCDSVMITLNNELSNLKFNVSDFITIYGYHNLPVKANAWIFLKDSFGYYKQNPPIFFIDKKNWEGTNIRIGEGIKEIVIFYVGLKEDEIIRSWGYGQISQSQINSLENSCLIMRKKIIPSQKYNYLMIDF